MGGSVRVEWPERDPADLGLPRESAGVGRVDDALEKERVKRDHVWPDWVCVMCVMCDVRGLMGDQVAS